MSDITERLEALRLAIRVFLREERGQSYDLGLDECFLILDGVAELNVTIERLSGQLQRIIDADQAYMDDDDLTYPHRLLAVIDEMKGPIDGKG